MIVQAVQNVQIVQSVRTERSKAVEQSEAIERLERFERNGVNPGHWTVTWWKLEYRSSEICG
jgi:hypothetical protein